MKTFRASERLIAKFPFGIEKAEFSKAENSGIHKHDFIELVYVVSGKSVHMIDDITYEVNQGDLLFIGYNQVHSFTSDEAMTHINFYIKPEYISESLANAETIYDVFSYFIIDQYFIDDDQKLPLATFSWSERIEFENLLNKCIEEAESKTPGYEFALNGYMQLIFASIIRSVRSNKNTGIVRSLTPQVFEYINENFDKKLTLNDIASKCFYTPSYLAKIFKKTLNMSLKDYICEKRVQQAQKLLIETDKSIETISSDVGYVNKNQFYKIFKEKTGCTPKQYRDNNS